MGTTTKIIYSSVLAVLITLMFLFFTMANNKQLKLDIQSSEHLAQQKTHELELLQKQLETSVSAVESTKAENAVIPELQTLVSTSKKENSELQAQLKAAQKDLAEFEALKKKFAESEESGNAAKAQVAELSAKIDQLTVSIEQKKRAIKFHKEKYEQQAEELSLLQGTASTDLLNLNLILDELVLKTRVIDELTSKIELLGGSADLPKEFSSSFTDESPTANNEIAALVSQLNHDNNAAALEDELTICSENLDKANTKLLVFQEEYNRIKTERQANLFTAMSNKEELNSENETLKITITEQGSIIKQLKDAIEGKEALVTSNQEEIEKLQAANQKVNEELANVRIAETTCQNEIEKLTTNLAAKQEEIETIKEQSNAIAVPLTAKVTTLQQQIADASTNNTTLEDELTSVKTTLEELNKEKETLGEELAQAKTALEGAQQKITELEKELDDTKAKVLLETNSYQALSTEIEPVKLALAQSEEKYEQLSQQLKTQSASQDGLAEMEAQLKTTEASLQEALDIKVQAEKETDKLTQDIAQLTETLAEKEKTIQGLTTQISDLKATVEQMNSQSSDNSSSVEEQKNKIAELVASLATAKMAMQSTEQQIAQFTTEKEELASKLQNALQSNSELTELSGSVKQKLAEMEEKAAASESLNETIAALESKVASLEEERNKLLPYSVDSDKDGIFDALDKCADSKEGAVVNEQGCENDSDQDGIADGLDLCPGTAAGADTDKAGCSAQQTTIVLEGISFQFGTSELTKEASATLNTAAIILKNNPDIKMEVAGHTDSVGDANANLQLSTSRAKAVLAFLISAGVAEDRLQAKGYGSTEPIADNATNEGRAKNRRVELRRVDQ